MTDVNPQRGSTVDYCAHWPDEGHSWSTTLHAGTPRVTTRRCNGCGFLDVSEVRAALLTAERQLLAVSVLAGILLWVLVLVVWP